MTNKKNAFLNWLLKPNNGFAQGSFTLVEVILAIGLMATFLVTIASVNGNSVYFSEYGRNVSKATWLAKRLMSQVDYYYHTRQFENLKGTDVTKGEFEGIEDFTYDIKIEEFPLPMSSIIANALAGGGAEDDDNPIKDVSKEGLKGQIDSMVKEFIGEDILKLAKVVVYWPEGAKRNSVELSYLMANNKKVGEVLGTLGAISGGSAPPGPGGPSGGSPPGGP